VLKKALQSIYRVGTAKMSFSMDEEEEKEREHHD
jgi:hypothetical protein